MPMHLWRRFRPQHAACVERSNDGVNYTSHHLRCSQLERTSKQTTCQQTSTEATSSRSWPSSAPSHGDQASPVDTSSLSQRCLEEATLVLSSSANDHTTNLAISSISTRCTDSSTSASLQAPLRCQIRPTRLTTLILYITLTIFSLSRSTCAAPIKFTHHINLHSRQAIPDKFGNTGNLPISLQSALPPPAAPPSSSLPAPTPTFSLTTPLNTTTPAQPTILNANPTPTPNPSLANGIIPISSALPLTRTSPQLPISPAAIAGLAGGAFILIIIVVLIAISIVRRRRIVITEIPKIPDALARQDSKTKKKKTSWGRGSKEMKAQEKREKGRPSISRPMPARPQSALPLGRLSGMGLGMGYLK